MLRKISNRIDVAILKRKEIRNELKQAIGDLKIKDDHITELLREHELLSKQAAKVEGLLDETIRQANVIEDLKTELEELTTRIDNELG
jgi:uncharacterized protein YdcH (DUF465 family)